MQLNFTGRNIHLTPALKNVTQAKFKRLEKRGDHIEKVAVIFQVENLTHIAEADFHLKGGHFHATAKAEDMYRAVDKLIDKLIIQMTRHKEKVAHH